MGDGAMQFQVPGAVVEEIIKAEIQAAVLVQLSKTQDKIIPAIVTQALTQKVDRSTGRPSERGYHSDSDPTYLTWLVEKMVRDMAQAVVKQWVEENTDKLRAELERQLKGSSKEMARVFMASLTNAIKAAWTFKVDVHFNSQDK